MRRFSLTMRSLRKLCFHGLVDSFHRFYLKCFLLGEASFSCYPAGRRKRAGRIPGKSGLCYQETSNVKEKRNLRSALPSILSVILYCWSWSTKRSVFPSPLFVQVVLARIVLLLKAHHDIRWVWFWVYKCSWPSKLHMLRVLVSRLQFTFYEFFADRES